MARYLITARTPVWECCTFLVEADSEEEAARLDRVLAVVSTKYEDIEDDAAVDLH